MLHISETRSPVDAISDTIALSLGFLPTSISRFTSSAVSGFFSLLCTDGAFKDFATFLSMMSRSYKNAKYLFTVLILCANVALDPHKESFQLFKSSRVISSSDLPIKLSISDSSLL